MAGEGGARPGTFWTKGDDTFHTVGKSSQSVRNAGGSRRPHRFPRRRRASGSAAHRAFSTLSSVSGVSPPRRRASGQSARGVL